MKNKILLMLFAIGMIAVSCSNEDAVNSANEEVEINSAKRSVIDIIATYSDIGSDNDLIIKKYEAIQSSTNPSVSVTVKSDAAKNMAFFGNAKKLTEGFADVYVLPTDYDEADASNSVKVDKTIYDFQTVTQMKMANGGNSISAGHVITWKLPQDGTESEDDVILVIRADYTELERENPTLYEPTVIVTADDGSYEVTSEDLAAFPESTPLIVTGVRGAYYNAKKSPFLVGTVSIFHSSTMYKN
jgi:hypothetical protein